MIRNFMDGDIVTSGEQFAVGKDATRLAIICRLRLFLGEYFLDATDGTPWFQNILGKTSRDIAETNIKQRIITTPGVVSLTEFDMTLDNKARKITITAWVIDINNERFDFLFDEDLF